MKTLLYNALIVNDDAVCRGCILIDGDTIAEVVEGDAPARLLKDDAVAKTDCGGDMLMPGVIDTHVHFRDPGLTQKADMLSESTAAVAGGVTSFVDMPNTSPATTTAEAWEAKMAHAAEVSAANYAFFLGATNDNLDTLLAADYTRVPGIKLFMGSSTGNMLVDSESMLDRLFAQSPALIMVHAEDEATIRANRARIEARYPEGDVPVRLHGELRSAEACFMASAHAVDLARRHGTRLHIAHVSTARELSLLSQGDVREKHITAETCPHYLMFTSADFATRGTRVKCNPAIKEEEDRRALIGAVKNGLIDTVATDHAPHLPADKEGDLFHAASGMPGVQFSLPLMLTMGFAPELVARLMSHNQALVFGIAGRGFLRPGYKADIVRVNKLAEPHTITDSDVVSRCGWTPYAGCRVDFMPVTTWVNGRVVWDNGTVTDARAAEPLRFVQLRK